MFPDLKKATVQIKHYPSFILLDNHNRNVHRNLCVFPDSLKRQAADR